MKILVPLFSVLVLLLFTACEVGEVTFNVEKDDQEKIEEDTLKVDEAMEELADETGALAPKGEDITIERVESMLESLIGPLQVVGGENGKNFTALSKKILDNQLKQNFQSLLPNNINRFSLGQKNGLSGRTMKMFGKGDEEQGTDEEGGGLPDCIEITPDQEEFEDFSKAMDDLDNSDNLTTAKEFLLGVDIQVKAKDQCEVDGQKIAGSLSIKATEGIDFEYDSESENEFYRLSMLKGALEIAAENIALTYQNEDEDKDNYIKIKGMAKPSIDLVNKPDLFQLKAGLVVSDVEIGLKNPDEILDEEETYVDATGPMGPSDPYADPNYNPYADPNYDPYSDPNADYPYDYQDYSYDNGNEEDSNPPNDDEDTVLAYYLAQSEDDPDMTNQDSTTDEQFPMEIDYPEDYPYTTMEDGNYGDPGIMKSDYPDDQGYYQPVEPKIDQTASIKGSLTADMSVEEDSTHFKANGSFDLKLPEFTFTSQEEGGEEEDFSLKDLNATGSIDASLENEAATLKVSFNDTASMGYENKDGGETYDGTMETDFSFEGKATGTNLKPDMIINQDDPKEYEGEIETLEYTMDFTQKGGIKAPAENIEGDMTATISSKGNIDRDSLDFTVDFSPEVNFLNPGKKFLDLEDLGVGGYVQFGLKFEKMEWGDAFLQSEPIVEEGAVWLSFSIEFENKANEETISLSMLIRAPIKDNEVDNKDIEFLIRDENDNYYLMDFDEDYEGDGSFAIFLIDEKGTKAHLEFFYDSENPSDYKVVVSLGGEEKTYTGTTFKTFEAFAQFAAEQNDEDGEMSGQNTTDQVTETDPSENPEEQQ